MLNPIIEVSNLVAGYGRSTSLDNISFTFEQGLVHAIIGKSGCGKTTLLKNMLGLMTYRAGSVKILGAEMSDAAAIDKEKIRQRTGVLFQRGALLNSMNIIENVALPLTVHTKMSYDETMERASELLKDVGLYDAREKRPTELSGGMVKRAAMARALSMKPEILFCDEPSAGLDPVTTKGIDELLLRLRKENNMTVVIVTHDLDSISRIADTILFIHDHKLEYNGTFQGALKSESEQLKNFFSRTS